jgi:hypothetical protein
MNSAISDLPIRTAIDMVLKDVGYSNPMPDWFVPLRVDYSARKAAVQNTIDRYLNGITPRKPFEVLVPRKRAGRVAKWLQLSLNDQMVLQACVSALAPRIDATFDRKRVFSYRYNRDPNLLQLTENQCDAAESFRKETASRGGSCTHIMLIDLEQAFASFNRSRFLDFLTPFSPTGIETKLLKSLLDGFESSTMGIPLINNALLFLGNAYLSVVDKVIANHTTDFCRFADDYCVFGDSRGDLESLYKHINKDLRQATEFKINEVKLHIFAAEDYCNGLSQTAENIAEKNLSVDETDAYFPVPENVDPNVMVQSLSSTFKDPDKYLNDGVGRSQLEAMRKLRRSLPPKVRNKFIQDLTDNHQVLQTSIKLLNKYTPRKEETWRSVWVLYMMKDIDMRSLSSKARSEVQNALQVIWRSRTTSEVVKLWAKWNPQAVPQTLFEELGDADYEETGRRCCGG